MGILILLLYLILVVQSLIELVQQHLCGTKPSKSHIEQPVNS